MATPLSPSERSLIRMYLGWSERFHQTDPPLEQAMNAFDGMPDDQQQQIRDQLAACQDVDDAIIGQRKRLKVYQVGKIRLTALDELAALRSEGRRFTGRIAALLGVAVRHDAWAGAGPKENMGWLPGLFGGGDGNEVKLG